MKPSVHSHSIPPKDEEGDILITVLGIANQVRWCDVRTSFSLFEMVIVSNTD